MWHTRRVELPRERERLARVAGGQETRCTGSWPAPRAPPPCTPFWPCMRSHRGSARPQLDLDTLIYCYRLLEAPDASCFAVRLSCMHNVCKDPYALCYEAPHASMKVPDRRKEMKDKQVALCRSPGGGLPCSGRGRWCCSSGRSSSGCGCCGRRSRCGGGHGGVLAKEGASVALIAYLGAALFPPHRLPAIVCAAGVGSKQKSAPQAG